MDWIFELFLGIHLLTGAVALTAFWIPALTRKGSRVHRAAGRWFVGAMTIVAITGIPLTVRLFAAGHWAIGTFLGYLVVITVTSISTAWFSLKLKRDADCYFGLPYRALAVLNLVAGGGVLYLGVAGDVLLLTLFSFIGFFTGFDMLRHALKPEVREGNWWLHEHLGGMIGGGIAAHVAFGAFGLRQLWPGYAALDGTIGMLPWILPVVIGIAASLYSSRKYSSGKPATT